MAFRNHHARPKALGVAFKAMLWHHSIWFPRQASSRDDHEQPHLNLGLTSDSVTSLPQEISQTIAERRKIQLCVGMTEPSRGRDLTCAG